MTFPARPAVGGRRRADSGSLTNLLASARWATAMAVADRRNRKRLLVMAFGIALCMLVLLALATVNPLIDAVTARDAARQPSNGGSGPAYQYVQVSSTAADHPLSGTLLSGPVDAPIPPGVSRFPADGELFVSPALADALEAPGSATLRAVLPGTVVGRIDAGVLTSAQDWTYYQGVAALVGEDVQTATGWGPASPQSAGTLAEQNPDLWLVMVTGVVVLMVPLLLFTALAGRIGAARRDRRSSLLRLLGASAVQLRWIVAAEVALASGLGIAVAAVGYVSVRLLAPWLSFAGYSIQAGDLLPDPTAAVIIALGVPVLAAVSAIAGARQATVDPLGTTQRSLRPPAVGWRIALVVTTALVTVYAMSSINRVYYYANSRAMLGLCAVVVLDVLCVAALVGPLTHGVAALWRRGGPAVQLAMGRLRQTPGLSTRSAAALATVTASVIALMSLLSGRLDQAALQAEHAAGDTLRPYTGHVSGLSLADWRRLDRDLAGIPGVQSVAMASALSMAAPAAEAQLATCDTVERYVPGANCTDGEVFGSIVAPPTATGDVFTVNGSDTRWSPPADSRNTFNGPLSDGVDFYQLTPSVAAGIPGVTLTGSTSVEVWMPPSSLAAARNATAWLGWQRAVVLNDNRAYATYDTAYSWVSAALLAGAALVLLICALGQWLLSAEYVDDRRRSFALARASGVGSTVLSRAVLVGALLPVIVGTALATGVGAVLAWEIKILRAGDPVPLATNWVAIAWGAAVLVTVAIALGSARQLRRTTGPAALRTE